MEEINKLLASYPVVRIGVSLLIFFLYLVVRKYIPRLVFKRAEKHEFEDSRSAFVKRIVRIGLLILFLTSIAIIWEVSFKGLSVYVASFLTIFGVGLFATWSIISNITASIILFFFFPLKHGSKVRIQDGDNSVEGIVEHLSIFSIKIVTEDKREVYYPNNLAIQKPIFQISGEGQR